MTAFLPLHRRLEAASKDLDMRGLLQGKDLAEVKRALATGDPRRLQRAGELLALLEILSDHAGLWQVVHSCGLTDEIWLAAERARTTREPAAVDRVRKLYAAVVERYEASLPSEAGGAQ